MDKETLELLIKHFQNSKLVWWSKADILKELEEIKSQIKEQEQVISVVVTQVKNP